MLVDVVPPEAVRSGQFLLLCLDTLVLVSRWMVTSGFRPMVNVSMASIHSGFPDVAPTSFPPSSPPLYLPVRLGL